jgi:C4-dicarboxylate transporter
MFMLSLAMEVYGTWLGNWTWAGEAPWLGFTTVNPPLAAGAFYCMLDMLVVASVARTRPGIAGTPVIARLAASRLTPAR